MSDEWQDIKTAPKDGTQLLLWTTTVGSDDEWYVRDICDGEHIAGPQIGRWNTDAGCWGILNLIGVPTHWMPLPAAPLVAPRFPDRMLRG